MPDCDEMVKTAQENGVIFMAGHVMNFFRGVRHAKQLIAEGQDRPGALLPTPPATAGRSRSLRSAGKRSGAKSGGHLYHHIHEVDCIQFIMGPATEVTMTGGNVAHQGEQFGDEDDMLFLNLEFGNNTYALIEYGSAFHWPEHYVLIQGTEGAIRIDMCNVGMTVKTKDGRRSTTWSTRPRRRTTTVPTSITALRWTVLSSTATPARSRPVAARHHEK